MASNGEISVAGLDELYKTLQELPGKVEGNVTVGALRAGQKVFADEARRRVPVKAGDLQKSIRIRVKRKSKQFGWVRVETVAGDKKAWYAHLIEFGTGSFYAGKGSKSKRAPYKVAPKKGKALRVGGRFLPAFMHPGIKPHAFMRGAFDTQQQQAIEQTADYLRKRLPRELAKR